MEDKMLKKAKFLSDNKDKIISNITKVSYPLFKILASDEDIEEIEDYNKIVEYLKNIETEILVSPEYTRDERYILETILAFVNKVAVDYNEIEAARESLSKYNKFFEKETIKVRMKSAI